MTAFRSLVVMCDSLEAAQLLRETVRNIVSDLCPVCGRPSHSVRPCRRPIERDQCRTRQSNRVLIDNHVLSASKISHRPTPVYCTVVATITICSARSRGSLDRRDALSAIKIFATHRATSTKTSIRHIQHRSRGATLSSRMIAQQGHPSVLKLASAPLASNQKQMTPKIRVCSGVRHTNLRVPRHRAKARSRLSVG